MITRSWQVDSGDVDGRKADDDSGGFYFEVEGRRRWVCEYVLLSPRVHKFYFIFCYFIVNFFSKNSVPHGTL